MPRLAVTALTIIAVILVLIFVRFRFAKHFVKVVSHCLDTLICVLLVALIIVCWRFSSG